MEQVLTRNMRANAEKKCLVQVCGETLLYTSQNTGMFQM